MPVADKRLAENVTFSISNIFSSNTEDALLHDIGKQKSEEEASPWILPYIEKDLKTDEFAHVKAALEKSGYSTLNEAQVAAQHTATASSAEKATPMDNHSAVELQVKMPLQWTTTTDTGKTRVIEAGPSHSTTHAEIKANMKMLKERMVTRSKLLAVDHDLNSKLRDSKMKRESRRSQNATSK